MRPAISLKDYETVFRVLCAVSNNVGNSAGKACLFYNVIGGFIVNKVLKRKARPVMGSAFIRVHDESNTVLAYSQFGPSGPTSDKDGFHCWIECDGFLIDFTAPVFRETFSEAGKDLPIARKMLQKPLSGMAKSWDSLTNEGDFWLESNPELTMIMLDKFFETPALSDLAEICMHWLQRYPKKIPDSMSMVNDLGEITDMNLCPIRVLDTW